MKKNFLIFLTAIVIGIHGKNIENFDENIKSSSNDQSYNKIWAVLVAASDNYSNYRHQANVLHAYQILNKKHGIPKEQIVLMMYDDIAFNKANPYQGNIINVPGGENLYSDDIDKDYIGDDVNPKNFKKILLGDEKLKKSGKKVLQSTENDHVFIYFTDHGAEGLICFPGKFLYASDLVNTLKEMKSKKMFKKMVFYLEACDSGSMFYKLLDDKQNIYALSSTDIHEPGLAKFYDEERKIYLTDEFSISWLLDAEKNDKEKKNELFNEQFENIKNSTENSHVKQFGDLKMASQYHVSDFIGKPISEIFFSNLTYSKTDEKQVISSREVEYYLTRIHSLENKDNIFEILKKNKNKTLNFINQLTTKLSQTLNVRKLRMLRTIY